MEKAELIALARLGEVKWRVETSSGEQPTVAVDLEVREQPRAVGVEPETRRETFEMSKGVLEAMLDGFSRIREQLSQV